MSPSAGTSDGTMTSRDKKNKLKTPKEAKNAAAGAHQKGKARKGANGVLLKKFESIMCDMFSSSCSPNNNNEVSQEALHHLTPRYSKLPPFMNDESQQDLVKNANVYWKSIGLARSDADASPAEINTNSVVNGAANGNNNSSSPWPFDSNTSLPKCGCVRSSDSQNKKKLKKTKTGKDTGGVGDVHNDQRARRKEMQLANLIQCVLALLPDNVRHQRHSSVNKDGSGATNEKTFRIVDFAGGTGHLAVPLALLLPQCEVVCVDLKKWSLDLLHQRVDGPFNIMETGNKPRAPTDDSHKLHCSQSNTTTSKTLPNLSTYHGSIQTYPGKFDIGVSLHACGEASDWVLRKCLQQKASWVVCSCCCGKLRRDAANPYVFQSTGGNEKEIQYPQSKVFATLGGFDNKDGEDDVVSSAIIQPRMSSEMFDELARAADYSELGDVRKPRNACRRAAKALVEWDRLLFAKECLQNTGDSETSIRDEKSNENVVLTRMVPWEASPKNDVIIGWFQDSHNPYCQRSTLNSSSEPTMVTTTTPQPDLSCDVDFQVALQHLFGNHNISNGSSSANAKQLIDTTSNDQNDWTAEEEAGTKSQIEEFLHCSSKSSLSNLGEENNHEVLKFPFGMGPRKRKLIHYVAESMGLRHWGEGKKDSEKIVLVARRQQK